MLLQTLELYCFRNYENTIINLENADSVFLIGKNGQGKTNFLEALYCLSYGNSFKTKKEEQLILHGKTQYKIKGIFSKNDLIHDLEISYVNKRKKILINGTAIDNRKDMLHMFPSLIFKHSDMFFISGGPEHQRQFLDQILVLNHSEYMVAFQQFKRTLLQKNASLKHENYAIIPIYNEQLAKLGLVLVLHRKKLVNFVNQYITQMFSEIFGEELKIIFSYCPSWNCTEEEYEDKNIVNILLDKLNSQIEQEKKIKTSISGPHRDIVKIMLGTHEFKTVASTGQIRILSLLFRLLQAKYYYQQNNCYMIYLFDDVLLELDIEKQKRFLQFLPPAQQAFYTFLPEEPLSNIIKSEKKKSFTVQNGMLEELIKI